MPDEEIPRDHPQDREDRRDESPAPVVDPPDLQTPQCPSEPAHAIGSCPDVDLVEQTEDWPEVGGPPAAPANDPWAEVEGMRQRTGFEWPGLRSV